MSPNDVKHRTKPQRHDPSGRVAIHPLTPQALFAVALSGMLGIYVVQGAEPSGIFQVVTSLAWMILMVCWVERDMYTRRQRPCFDFGYFCYLAMPFSVAWYCLWSRGWRGFGILMILAALSLVPYYIAAMVWVIMQLTP